MKSSLKYARWIWTNTFSSPTSCPKTTFPLSTVRRISLLILHYTKDLDCPSSSRSPAAHRCSPPTTPACPEAACPGALYVNAEDVQEIAQGIVRLCQDADLRQTLHLAGQAHAARFTWQRSAEQLWCVHENALSS